MGNTGIKALQPIDAAAWIWYPETHPVSLAAIRNDVFASGWREPAFLRFRRELEVGASRIRIDVNADERFELFLDGRRITRGPDRYDVEHCCNATCDLRLTPGKHSL